MLIEVEVRPGSSRRRVFVKDDGTYKVHLHSPPVEGRANAELLQALAKYFNCAKSQIVIKRGQKSRQKQILIED
ncbi:MAG TPA: YggU family protein [Candidatus Wirthbacteria bacterium]|nr:YggU family protein [Candidatus Wirthbacteria bacterium]